MVRGMSRATVILAPPAASLSSELPMLRVISPPPKSDGPAAAATKASLDTRKLVLTDELQGEIERENQRLEAAQPQEILRWATDRFAPRFTMATAFGPEGMVLIHMLAEIA